MLNHSGIWSMNLNPANSNACLVSVRLPGLLYSEHVVERGQKPTQPEVQLSDPSWGLHPPRGRGTFFRISTKMLSGLEVALSGLKGWDSKKA